MKGSVLFFALLLTVGLAQADPRLWGPEGIPVRQGSFLEWRSTSATDPAGNTIAVWSDARSGNREVYAQLVSPAGVPLWTAGGINLSNSPGQQEAPVVCLANGGWIIAWVTFEWPDWWNRTTLEEEPYPTGSVWAQKVNNGGVLLWGPTGVPVDTFQTAAYEWTMAIAHDAAGGAIVTWQDCRGNHCSTIYAQRVLTFGQTAWLSPLQVTNLIYVSGDPAATGDGNGNVIVVWSDHRGTNGGDLYAAKITPDGALPWGGQNGTVMVDAPASQFSPKVCADGEGGVYVVWRDDRSGNDDVYAQRVNADGTPLWADNGIPVCTEAYSQRDLDLAPSFSGAARDGMLAAWSDRRVDGEIGEIFAQKVSPEGVVQWLSNGVRVCGNAGVDSSGQYTGQPRNAPVVTSDLAGGMACAWFDTRVEFPNGWYGDVYAGRVLSNGVLDWLGECGNVVADGPYSQDAPVIVVKNNALRVVYSDQRTYSESVRFQKLDLAAGGRMLPDTGVVLATSLDGEAQNPVAVPMSGGRTAFVWRDGRKAYNLIYYQVMNGAGQPEKALNGVPLAPDTTGMSYYYLQEAQRACPDGSGGFFCTYEDMRTGMKRIRLSHVNAAGDVTSAPTGELVWEDAETMDQVDAYCAPDGQGGCYVAWTRYNMSYWMDSYVMRLDAGCHRLWSEPVRLTNDYDDEYLRKMTVGPDGCCIVVWKSGTYGNFNISAAKVCADRNIVYNFDVCNAPTDQEEPAMIPDGQSGVYIAWSDLRNSTAHPGYDLDIYAQHLNAQGAELWAHNGVAVCSDTLYQNDPQLVLTGDQSLICAWEGYDRGASQSQNLRMQKLDAAGAHMWPDTGFALCNAPGDQFSLSMVPDNGNGVFALWTDQRVPAWYTAGVYGTHLGPGGSPVGDPYWTPRTGGMLASASSSWNVANALVSDGAGGFIAAWMDDRACSYWPSHSIYAQRLVDAAGVDKPAATLPSVYALSQNYPNPFNPVTQISFALPKAGKTTLRVYDLLGREVATLVDRTLPAGEQRVSFDGGHLASGMYFYRLESGSFSAAKKMLLLK